jgi:hypothetical protein
MDFSKITSIFEKTGLLQRVMLLSPWAIGHPLTFSMYVWPATSMLCVQGRRKTSERGFLRGAESQSHKILCIRKASRFIRKIETIYEDTSPINCRSLIVWQTVVPAVLVVERENLGTVAVHPGSTLFNSYLLLLSDWRKPLQFSEERSNASKNSPISFSICGIFEKFDLYRRFASVKKPVGLRKPRVLMRAYLKIQESGCRLISAADKKSNLRE